MALHSPGGGLFLIALGILFLLTNYGYVSLHFWNLIMLWPLFLICPGIALLLDYASPSTKWVSDLGLSLACIFILIAGLTSPLTVRTASGSVSGPLGIITSSSVSINHGMGVLILHPISTGNLYEVSYTSAPEISYSETGGKGIVTIKSSGFVFPLPESISIGLNSGIPLDLSVHTGASSYSLDLSGMRVSSLMLEGGASSGEIFWNSSNPVTLGRMDINAGASSLTLSGLGYANVRNLILKGGAGSYTLDFSGDYTGTGIVSIDSGLSSVSIRIPPNLGARVIKKDQMSSMNTACLSMTEPDTYETPNYNSASGRFDITINGGLISAEINACQ